MESLSVSGWGVRLVTSSASPAAAVEGGEGVGLTGPTTGAGVGFGASASGAVAPRGGVALRERASAAFAGGVGGG